MSETTKGQRSRRVAFLEQSQIRGMTAKCREVGGINLGQGICPLPSPPELLKAASKAVSDDKSIYSKYSGVSELREAVAAKLKRYNGLQIDADRELVTTVGSAGAFCCTLQGLFNPGDEIIVFEPYYGYHINAIKVSGCRAKTVRLRRPDWRLEPGDLEAALSENTRAVLVNTPGNPSGKVFGEDELEAIAAFCQRHDLLAVTDEIYEYMVFDGHRHRSLATFEGMRERTVTISGFSKTFAITGWRLGYAAAPPELAEPIGLVNDLFYICAPTPLQYGLAEALEVLDDGYYDQICERYRQNRDLFCEALREGGLEPMVPQGSYYVLADVSALGCEDSKQAAMKLLGTTGVASVPGSAFFDGDGGRDLVRFCVAQPRDVLEEAAQRMADGIN